MNTSPTRRPRPKLFTALLLSGMAALLAVASGQTTIDATDKHAYGANIGWINLHGDSTNGVRVTDYVCSGFGYGANVGWIHFGDGTPATGIAYQNNSAGDYGVNVTNFECPAPGVHTADLRGFAYGANIGWINFEKSGEARVDLTTGKLRGYAWGANVGWINLGELSGNVHVVTSLAPGVDSDTDGIADGWEYTRAGFPDLVSLGGLPTDDADDDGQSDLSEYLADTDPFDPMDRLRITVIAAGVASGDFDVTFTSRPTRIYHLQANPDLTSAWADVVGPIKPTGATSTATVTDPGGDDFHFWRATAALPLQP